MGKCSPYCSYPQLPVESSQHRCPNCGNKFHGLCSNVKHPRADELNLTMGNDHLCPSCVRSVFGSNVVPPLGSESPRSDKSSGSSDCVSSDDSSLSGSTKRLLSLENNSSIQKPNVVVDTSLRGWK